MECTSALSLIRFSLRGDYMLHVMETTGQHDEEQNKLASPEEALIANWYTVHKVIFARSARHTVQRRNVCL